MWESGVWNWEQVTCFSVPSACEINLHYLFEDKKNVSSL